MITEETLMNNQRGDWGSNLLTNGNFDLWQRGTSVAIADLTLAYLADRWFDVCDKNGGTLPTLTRQRGTLTSGDIANSMFYTNLTTNGAGTSLGNASYHILHQSIEHGTRYFGGKSITITFWAKSNIANKRIGIDFVQSYGSGGTPTSSEAIIGSNWTLTSSWTYYSLTVSLNTLIGKTFGTNFDDALQIRLWYMWGSTNQAKVGASTAETYVGSGIIDIAQVRIVAGSYAPNVYQPRSVSRELEMAYRYCYVWENQTTVIETFGFGYGVSTTVATIALFLPVFMRIVPAITATAGDYQVNDGTTATDLTSIALGTASNQRIAVVNCTVASGLTNFRPYRGQSDGTLNRKMILSADLS